MASSGKLALNHDHVEPLREEQRPQRYLATVSPHRHVRVARDLAVGVAPREATWVVQATPRGRRIDQGACLIPDQFRQLGRLLQPSAGGIAERRFTVLHATTQSRAIGGDPRAAATGPATRRGGSEGA